MTNHYTGYFEVASSSLLVLSSSIGRASDCHPGNLGLIPSKVNFLHNWEHYQNLNWICGYHRYTRVKFEYFLQMGCKSASLVSDSRKSIFSSSSNVNISNDPFRDAFLKMIEEEVGHEVLNQQTLRKFAQKINFNLRLSEIVRQTSCTSNLVVMTLPVPKKDNVPTALYLSLLDFITRDMSPFFLVRGNQDSVLTFYS